jgi:putative peptidoglycan lipid II flippase
VKRLPDRPAGPAEPSGGSDQAIGEGPVGPAAAVTPAPPESGSGGEASLRRATIWMAAGTGVSRLTGVFRVIALAYALGATRLADGYNLANTAPNMLYDIVLGGVLAATFIPVFVSRLTTRSERDAWQAISAVVTLSVVVLALASAVFWLAAPAVIAGITALDPSHGAVASQAVAHQREVATSLLRWFVPQVFFYGLISLITALLNTRRRFVAPMWVPIANNVVCIAVLLWFGHVDGAGPSLTGVQQHHDQLLLLGIGTTLGVVVQTLLLLPSLRRAGVPLLRWRWDPRNEAVTTIARLGAWTFGFVVANQIALFVILALAGSAPGPAPVSSWTYAYTFFQMPYAIVAVSVMSAVTPDLAQRWTAGDVPGFLRRLTGGLRAVLVIIIPASVGLLLLAKLSVELLLAHGSTTIAGTSSTGSVLAMFALGLPGFCTFLYIVRVLQAMQRPRIAFWLYLLENGINIVLALALVRPLGVRGLALSLSIAYSVAAIAGVVTLRRWLGPLGTPQTWAPLRPVAASSAAMAVVVLLVSDASGSTSTAALLLRVGGAVLCGVATFAGVAVLLGRRASKARRERVFVAGSRDGRPLQRP